jgi:hypothetical protein
MPGPSRPYGLDARRRLSSVALKAFLRAANHWGLSDEETADLMGERDPARLERWRKAAFSGRRVTLSDDRLYRLGLAVGIYGDLRVMLPDDAAAGRWLRAANTGPGFSGAAPLSVMRANGIAGLEQTRLYLNGFTGSLDFGRGIPPPKP